MCVQDHAAAFDLRGLLHLGTAGQRTLAVWLQAQAQAQAQNMAFQAHNLQAHAQQLEVESAHPVSTHMNVGLQHQVDQVHTAIPCSPPQALGPFVVQFVCMFGRARHPVGASSPTNASNPFAPNDRSFVPSCCDELHLFACPHFASVAPLRWIIHVLSKAIDGVSCQSPLVMFPASHCLSLCCC